MSGIASGPGLRHRCATKCLQAIALGLLLTPPVQAVTWTGDSLVDSFWSDAANWDVPPAALSPLTFSGVDRLTNTNDLTAGFIVKDITFDNTAGAFNLYGNALTLEGNIVNNSAQVQTLHMPLTLSGTSRVLNAATGGLRINGPITLGIHTLFVSGAAATTLSGSLNGTGGLRVTGAGGVALTGSSSFGTAQFQAGVSTAYAGATSTVATSSWGSAARPR